MPEALNDMMHAKTGAVRLPADSVIKTYCEQVHSD